MAAVAQQLTGGSPSHRAFVMRLHRVHNSKMNQSRIPRPWPLPSSVGIVQAPMGPVVSPELCAAVANAGGIGMLAVTWLSQDLMLRTLERVRALTDGTIGVNLVLDFDIDAQLELALELQVPVISTFWGDPGPVASRIADSAAVHLHTVGSVDDARRAAAGGVDVLVAQGVEAGGHVHGTVPLDDLLRQVTGAVDLPVIAAGGIATADDVRRVIGLGACGVWVGTRFVAAGESHAHPAFKQAIVDATAQDSVWTADCFDGAWPNAPHRVLRNSTVERYLATGIRQDRDQVAATPRGAPIARYDERPPLAGMTGDVLEMALYAGTGVGGIDRVLDAAEIVRELARGLSTG